MAKRLFPILNLSSPVTVIVGMSSTLVPIVNTRTPISASTRSYAKYPTSFPVERSLKPILQVIGLGGGGVGCTNPDEVVIPVGMNNGGAPPMGEFEGRPANIERSCSSDGA